jgi:hypothetical protein
MLYVREREKVEFLVLVLGFLTLILGGGQRITAFQIVMR